MGNIRRNDAHAANFIMKKVSLGRLKKFYKNSPEPEELNEVDYFKSTRRKELISIKQKNLNHIRVFYRAVFPPLRFRNPPISP